MPFKHNTYNCKILIKIMPQLNSVNSVGFGRQENNQVYGGNVTTAPGQTQVSGFRATQNSGVAATVGTINGQSYGNVAYQNRRFGITYSWGPGGNMFPTGGGGFGVPGPNVVVVPTAPTVLVNKGETRILQDKAAFVLPDKEALVLPDRAAVVLEKPKAIIAENDFAKADRLEREQAERAAEARAATQARISAQTKFHSDVMSFLSKDGLISLTSLNDRLDAYNQLLNAPSNLQGAVWGKNGCDIVKWVNKNISNEKWKNDNQSLLENLEKTAKKSGANIPFSKDSGFTIDLSKTNDPENTEYHAVRSIAQETWKWKTDELFNVPDTKVGSLVLARYRGLESPEIDWGDSGVKLATWVNNNFKNDDLTKSQSDSLEALKKIATNVNIDFDKDKGLNLDLTKTKDPSNNEYYKIRFLSQEFLKQRLDQETLTHIDPKEIPALLNALLTELEGGEPFSLPTGKTAPQAGGNPQQVSPQKGSPQKESTGPTVPPPPNPGTLDDL